MVLLQQGTIFFEKQWFCCNRVPFSSKNNGFVATYYFLGEGFKGGGFEVCGRQDLDFKFRKNKITKWNLPKTIGKTIEKQWFLVMKMWKVNRSRVAPQPSLALARAKSPLRGAGGYSELVAIVACRRPGELFAETPKNRVFGI